MLSNLYSQCLIKTDSYRLVCADEVRYADSIASGTRLYISSRNAYVTSPRSVFNLVEGYGQFFIKITNAANSQKVAIGRQWINRIDSTGAGKALIYLKDINVTFTTTESYSAIVDSAISCFQRAVASGLATLSDGDYGDVVVSGGGLVMTVDKPDLGLQNMADGDFSVIGDSTALSLTNTRQITLQTKNIDGWISRYLQTNNSLTLRTNSSSKTSRIFVDTTGANFQFVNGSNNASLRIGDSVAVRFNSSGSVGQVLTVTSVDGDGRLVINPKAGGSGTANCEQTLTKTSHGFSKWTPIYWNGSTWARPTYDSIIPTYIVVDSTTANTFKVSNCGNYDTDLSSGLYYYKGASPGYSLTPTSIPSPLFEVAESRLILQPLVGFQLAGSGGAAIENVTYTTSDSTSTGGNPSTTNGVVNILKYTGNGSSAVPSFSKIEDAFSGTARVVPYLNSGGRMVLGNTYFKLDTNTTSGAQARVRLLINNPNGDLGEGDSYSSLSVRTGDGLGLEAITNFGDQAITQGTTGYDAVMQLSRTGGNFTTKSNLSNGNSVGKFAWRGYVNSGSRALGHVQLNYTGDGTTINSEILAASGVSGSVVNGWKLDNQSRFWLGSGADDYYFPTIAPISTSGAISSINWVGGTPSFLRSQHGVATGTTDGSGDLTVTFAAAMPDATYSLIATAEGTTYYTTTVHTKGTSTVKVRFFDAAGAAVTATSVTISYEAKDY